MNKNELFQSIKEKRSFLCVGLDTDIVKIPEHLKNLPDPLFFFNKEIIDATAAYSVAYKPNLAFYESIKMFGLENTTAYFQYCPMANNDKGAYWLSSKKDILNPYFGDAMLTCGETKETIK